MFVFNIFFTSLRLFVVYSVSSSFCWLMQSVWCIFDLVFKWLFDALFNMFLMVFETATILHRLFDMFLLVFETVNIFGFVWLVSISIWKCFVLILKGCFQHVFYKCICITLFWLFLKHVFICLRLISLCTLSAWGLLIT